MKLISKSRFLQYHMCPKDAWFRLHMPDLEEFEVSTTEEGVMAQGVDAEEYSKQLKIFEGYAEVTTWGYKAKDEIDTLIAQGVPALYQPTFVADGFIIRCDFLVRNTKTKKWDLYEVKATNSKKDGDEDRDHISDVTFQTIVLERAGMDLGKKYVVHLNKEYVRGKKLDIEKLFVISDSTDQVKDKKEEIAEVMEKAKKYLNQEKEPKGGCECHFYGRSSHCSTCSISHPEIPEYSVHDISRIGSGPKLRKFIEEGIYHLHDIEDISDLSEIQQNQIHTHKTGEVLVDKEEIRAILDSYSYPLYFFDYETFAPAVPLYEGYKTYQRIPIQFSLHVIDKKGGPVRHIDYLHEENSDPTDAVAKMLIEAIDPKGTVLAWNYSFEKTVTKEMGDRNSEYAKALNRICKQMKDLRDIFSKQHYVHKDFKGSSGIDSVMEVLLPEMSYDHLPYTGADVGYVWWSDIVNDGEEPKNRAKMVHLVKEYCKQDTFVMVEIFRVLNDVIKQK